MTRRSDAVPEDPVNFGAREAHQAGQWSISGFLPPLTEQMKDEEQGRRLLPCRRFQRKESFDLLDEEGQHFLALGSRSLQRFFRETSGIGEFVEDFSRFHRNRFHQGSIREQERYRRFGSVQSPIRYMIGEPITSNAYAEPTRSSSAPAGSLSCDKDRITLHKSWYSSRKRRGSQSPTIRRDIIRKLCLVLAA